MGERSTKVPGFPKPPASVSVELRKFLEAIVEAIEIRLGRRGDPLDRAVTLRELIDSGLAKKLRSSPFDPNNISDGNIGFQDPDSLVATAIPLRPTGFTVSGAYSTINLGWDYPLYKHHNQTEIWSHPSDVLGDATLAGVSTGRGFTDPVGGGVTRYYWIRHVNTSGTKGPWNATAGTVGQTATDVSHTLGVLSGAITSSELAASLASPIGNLPANTNSEISTLTSTTNTINSTVNGHSTSIQTNLTSINGLKGEYTVKVDANGHVAGFGLASTFDPVADAATSEFFVNADRFAILPDQVTTATAAWSSGTTYSIGTRVMHQDKMYQARVVHSGQTPPNSTYWDDLSVLPFSVTTSGTTVNGTYVPAGVYINNAMIKHASITSAQIGSVDAETISSGYLNVTDRIDTNAINASKIRLDGSTIDSVDVNGIPTVQIAALGVTTAKIGNAAVESLQVGGSAITASGYVSKAFSSTNTATLSMSASSTTTTIFNSSGGQPYIFHVMAIVNEDGTNPSSYDLKVTTKYNGQNASSTTYWLYAYGTDVVTVRRTTDDANNHAVSCVVECFVHNTTTAVNNCMIQITGHTGKR